MDDRRFNERFPFCATEFIQILVNDDYEVLGAIENISSQGMKLEILPTGSCNYPQLDDAIRIMSCSEGLKPLLTNHVAHVVWIDGIYCGLNFTPHLKEDSAHLFAYLKDLEIII